MNRKAQVVETLGAVVILIGSLIGLATVFKDISNPSYIGNMATEENETACVFEISCTSRIQEIKIENRRPFFTLDQAQKEGFLLCKCP